MKITLKEVTVGEIVNGFVDNAENGVYGYDGKLNIRPKFQREFVYDIEKQKKVIQTILRGFPLNVMYWALNEDGTYELLDGQQRTMSFCRFVKNYFSITQEENIERAFENLTKTEQQNILDYKLFIYVCDGNDKERLEWFKTINIAGMALTNQELRNACYTGEWLTSAKVRFSKSGCTGAKVSEYVVKKQTIRQELLETAIDWISQRDHITIEGYMSKHQHDTNADELWLYFRTVCEWAEMKFNVHRKEMINQPWNTFYEKCKDKPLDAKSLEEQVSVLMNDEEVQNKRGIYPYVLFNEKTALNLRSFPDKIKREVYEKQKGICPHCVNEKKDKTHFELNEMEADHIVPWTKGGKTVIDNCQMLCIHHNKVKSDN